MAKLNVDTKFLKYLASKVKQEYSYPVSTHYNKGVDDFLKALVNHVEKKEMEAW